MSFLQYTEQWMPLSSTFYRSLLLHTAAWLVRNLKKYVLCHKVNAISWGLNEISLTEVQYHSSLYNRVTTPLFIAAAGIEWDTPILSTLWGCPLLRSIMQLCTMSLASVNLDLDSAQ